MNYIYCIIFSLVICLTSISSILAEDTAYKHAGLENIGGSFELIDHTGRKVTEKDFLGKYSLVFFGFTHCPYACPLGLSTIAATLNKLDNISDKITPIFITIDPERDDQKRIAEFVVNFHKNLIGLTGTKKELEKTLNKYRGYSRKVQIEGQKDYLFDHSTIIYFMDEEGKFITHFSSEMGADEITKQIKKIIGN